MDDEYLSVGDRSRAEVKVDGSRFIAEAFGVRDRDDALDTLGVVRQRLYDATHHCFAYRLGEGANIFRSYDDGEPSGTAGQPILQQIDARGLTNTLVVVTRYFGGTKLGKGGLARAYGTAAASALDAGRIERNVIEDCYVLHFEYEDTSGAIRTVESVHGTIKVSKYTERTKLIVAVRRSDAAEFQLRFVENLGGRGSIQKLPECLDGHGAEIHDR